MTNYAAINARYAVVITRHRTPSAWPGAGADDGDQDADTAPEPLPVEPATPSTAALRSVGGEFCCLFYGASKIGAVAVPLNTRLAAPEVDFILSDCGSKVVIYGEASATVVDAIKADTDSSCTVSDWVPAGGSIDSLAERLKAADANEPAGEYGGADNLFIMYTSGTTGHPKGVVHTHDSVHSAASSWCSTIDVRYQDRLLLHLPMFHVAALTTVIFCAMRGASLISMPQFDPMKVWS